MGEYGNNWRNKKVTITGGAGFLGRKLAEQLIRQGVELIILLDVRPPSEEFLTVPIDLWRNKIQFLNCDIRDFTQVAKGIEKANDCVFHLCSFGMSGREQLDVKKVEQINIQGTKNVIDACLSLGVSSLIYTSTTNVCFNGKVLDNKDESLPYATTFVDAYSRTKTIAEKLVIESNNKEFTNAKGTLATCSIRPAGIYGEGEERHIPRIVNLLYNHVFFFTVGPKNSLVEFVHIENLVSAHIRAAERLMKIPLSIHQNPKLNHTDYIYPDQSNKFGENQRKVVAGQVYFISDCHPINNFEFFRPMIEGLGYKYPIINMPTTFMFYLAWTIEIIHKLVRKFINFQPLTRAEIYKVAVTHYFKPDKAFNELQYVPFISYKEGMDRVVNHLKIYMPPPKTSILAKLILFLSLLVLLATIILYIL